VEGWIGHSTLAERTGMVIPAYFSAKPSTEMIRQLLWITLGDCGHYLPWEHIWVVVDGDLRTAELVTEVRGRLGEDWGAQFNLIVLPENRGKLWAIRQGIAALLGAWPQVDYIVIRDGDGDHAIADMPTLVRMAWHLHRGYGHSRCIVAGARRSRHRPMGWLRGELEPLLDRLTLDALAYRLAQEGRALNLGHCQGAGVPDISSGYKVYGREMAEELFVRAAPNLASLTAEDYWHYGPETVTIVEGALRGAVLAEAPRLTWDGQPTTSFGEFRELALYGELLAWVYTRLEIPLAVAAQLYDNVAPHLTLRTTAQGAELLSALRAHVLDKVRAFRGEGGPLPAPPPAVPFL